MAPRRKNLIPFALPLLGLLVVLVALGSAGSAAAQCPWDAAALCAPGSSGPYSMCSRGLAYLAGCGAPMNNGMGTSCTPPSAAMVGDLTATQTNTADQAAAFCSWACTHTGAGGSVTTTCRIDLLDGLPVELMEFSIDADAEDGATAGEKEPGDAEAG